MRLFVAVRFPATVRRALSGVVRELSDGELPVRWTPPARMHLTLRWLGERSAEERDAAAAVMERVAAASEPFEAGFGALGAFPSPRRPRVLWIAVDATPRLRVLRDELERGFAGAGLGRDDRSFRPHVTLGRARSDAGPGAFRSFVDRGAGITVDARFDVSAIQLVRSRLAPDGARYETVASAALGA